MNAKRQFFAETLLKSNLLKGLRSFEQESGKTVRSIRLVRKDQPIVFRDGETDLVDLEIEVNNEEVSDGII